VAAGVSGCTRVASSAAQRGEDGALGIPSDGRVRIVATRVAQTADAVHWKWSVIGERNWTGVAAKETDLSLTGTYPLNDATRRGGCNVYEADLTAERAGKDGAGRWKLTLHGSNGSTETSEGDLPAGKTADAVKIVQDTSTVERLPAAIRLAEVDGRPVTLNIAR
jgi:hypothetical protein